MRDFPFRAKTEAPTSPYRLSLGSWGSALRSTVKEFLADDCLGLAQQIAFSSLLAFFPSVILVIGLLGLIGSGAYDSLVHLLGSVAPKGVLDAIDLAKQSSADNQAGSVIALFIGVVGALWAASGATASIIKAVNRAEDLEESRPFWKVRLLALALVMLTGLVSAILFLLIIFGGPIGEAVAKRADLGSEFTVLWDILRWPIAFAGILAFFAIVYWLAPNRSPRNWKWLTPGSILGAVLWLALSGLFALYTSFSSSYDRTYGSLAGAIILLLWLNYSAVALLMGAELNAELDRRASGRAKSRGTRP